MKQELYFDRHSGLILSALMEDGRLVELGIENEAHREIVGNIYKGRVSNVIESMNAAFVDCGLERNCFLPLSDGDTMARVAGVTPSPQTARRGVRVAPLRLKPGDEVIVQVVKNPRGNKGAKVSARLSFVGKNLIYMPGTDFLGISHKISEAELRDNLLFTADGMRAKGDGLILRTVAPYATASRLRAEVEYLRNIYLSVLEKNKTASVGAVLHREFDLPVRVMRDNFNDDIERIVVGERSLFEELSSLIRLRPDFDKRKIELYTGEYDMFSQYGIARQICELSESSVPLPNGGDLIIERTEAMTVVDVNTGRFVGDENLEDTVYATNIAAAREIARQVRLRDVGGIVVVDFIDMQDERHRKAVTQELTQCLSRDRVKCKVLPMNELCLVEFTRKRTTNGVASQLLQPCPHCRLNGYILANEVTVCLIRADILGRLAQGAATVIVEMNAEVTDFFLSRRVMEKDIKARAGKKIYLVPHRTYHEEKFTVTSYGAGQAFELPANAKELKYD